MPPDNIKKEVKREHNYFVNAEGKLVFSHPTFKDDKLVFHAKGKLKEDTTKRYGIHLC